VNNAYLDSPARRDYHDHINGVANRSKTRVRWYGQQHEVAECPMLERKLKRGMVSGKETHALPPLLINRGCLRSLLETAFNAGALPLLLRSELRHVEPALFNCYQRHYFLSREGGFRLTVDSRLQFASLPHNRGPAIRSVTPVTTLVIELKFGHDLVEYADCVTNVFPFRLARFSKYVVGIERI
jgi:hypothetical protein